MEASASKCPKCGTNLNWSADAGPFCPSCGWKEAAPPSQSGLVAPAAVIASEPPEGFNWGAFFVPFWWSIGMRLWTWAIVLFVVPLVGTIVGIALYSHGPGRGGVLGALILPVTGPLFYLCAGIYLGAVGNRMAWKSRPFSSVAEFRATQRVWAMLGAILFILAIALFFLGGGRIRNRLREFRHQRMEQRDQGDQPMRPFRRFR